MDRANLNAYLKNLQNFALDKVKKMQYFLNFKIIIINFSQKLSRAT